MEKQRTQNRWHPTTSQTRRPRLHFLKVAKNFYEIIKHRQYMELKVRKHRWIYWNIF